MAGWSDGYFTDVQYTSHYFGYMAPGALALACLRRGVRPPPLRSGATYMELGCGQGFGLNLLAAANPHLNFIGIDFHPGQVANARTLAAEAGLTNITFEDFSFEQVLALPEGRLPKCDVIALHGVVSWISPENRARAIRIIDRQLQPGGLAAISYNAYPGWAALLPLQRFVKAYVARVGGDPLVEVVNALSAAKAMADTGVGTLARAPQIRASIDRQLKAPPAYLLHEFVHEHFHPLFHDDLVREANGARLTYVGQAHSVDDNPSLCVPAAHRAQVQATADPWRETLIDYATDRTFRRDLFLRGPNRLTTGDRAERLGKLRFALTKPPGRVSLEFTIPLGKLNGDPATYGGLMEALGDGPKSYDELLALRALAGDDALLLKALGLLMENGAVHPVVEDADPAPAQRFNRALLARLERDETPAHLAAPAIGAGVSVRLGDIAGLAAPGGEDGNPAAGVQLGRRLLERTGVLLQRNGQPIDDPNEAEVELTIRVADFLARYRPLLARLGVI